MADEPLTADDSVSLESYQQVCGIFSALSSPARAAVIHMLSHGEHTAGQLHEHLDISQPLLSQHLRILREAKLVLGRREGRQIHYSLADEHVSHIFLDALNHVDHDDTPGDTPDENF